MSEYETMRNEMLQRFARVHYLLIGTTVAVAYLVYYYIVTSGLAKTHLYFLSFIIVLLLTVSSYICLRLFYGIYQEGSYLAIFHELDGKEKWHLRSRLVKKVEPCMFHVYGRWGKDGFNALCIYISLLILSLSLLLSLHWRKPLLVIDSVICLEDIISILLGIGVLIFFFIFISKLWKTHDFMIANLKEWYKYYDKHKKDDYKTEDAEFRKILNS
ncbi:MAG: hypothetical protein P9L98_03880 [Candidatus Kaelpia imicola]|nr:hypothetical protein [Candidatus Kaelpia imicola]